MTRSSWAALSAGILALTTGVYLHYRSVATLVGSGRFVYPLDDAYIHLGLARRWLSSGTWGINADEFASASSSPAWTVLVAGGLSVSGGNELAPLLLAAVCAAALLVVVVRWWAATTHESWLGVIALILFVPLPFLVALGMEHVLQLLIVVSLATLTTRQPPRQVNVLVAAVLAGCAALVRYELLFAVFWLAVEATRSRRYREAGALVLGASTAAGAFAAFSLAQGGYALPNSVLMKSLLSQGFAGQLQANLSEGVAVWVLAALSLALPAAANEHGSRRAFAFTALTHLLLARMGWVYRYEAWLVGWGCIVVIPGALRWSTDASWSARLGFLLLLIIPLGQRAFMADSYLSGHARSNHDNGVEIARLVAAKWNHSIVAVHDIGAISYYTDATIVDLAGIGTTEVTRDHLAGQLNGGRFDTLCRRRGVEIAFAHEGWMADDLPASFTEVGRWEYKIPDGRSTASTIAYALPSGNSAKLAAELAAQAALHPDRVRFAPVAAGPPKVSETK